jgi:tRNA threonylcarbamoyladenosine biosynthesis protein TsaB
LRAESLQRAGTGMETIEMKILGIDTSTSCGSVGLVDGDSVIAEYLLNIPTTHSERLLNSVEYVLEQAGCSIKDLDGWAISLGPGSFTGLRIGMSTIKGLAFATEKPVAGVPTLDTLASNISPTPYLICPILDARKGEVYASLYRYDGGDSPKRASAYQAISPENLVKNIKEKTIFLGNGVNTYGDYLLNALPTLATFVSAPLNLLRGSAVARLGLKRIQEHEVLDLSTFTPIYVRASEAEVRWKEKHWETAQ